MVNFDTHSEIQEKLESQFFLSLKKRNSTGKSELRSPFYYVQNNKWEDVYHCILYKWLLH